MKSQRVPLVREIKEMDMCIFCMCVRVCASVCVLVWDLGLLFCSSRFFSLIFWEIGAQFVTLSKSLVISTRCKISAEN